MTEDKKAQRDRWPPGGRLASKWWLLAKDGSIRAGVLLCDCGGAQALPVFSGEGEAEMFVWLGGAFEDGWRVRQTSAGELVSILFGPCAGVGRVALDPAPGMTAETIHLVSMTRERFVSWILDNPCSISLGVLHHTRRLVRPL
jgi:hypothetical protein